MDVARLLEIPPTVLSYVLYRTDLRESYRSFEIPKTSGEPRLIQEPPPTLKIIQSKLNQALQIAYRPKPSAHGFILERSILSNALGHTGKQFVLNVDLSDFFPSINFGRVRGVFLAKPYELGERAATVLAQICCYEGRLPQGAPTSPIVSNMICARLDSNLQKLARKHWCTYTRYADDITFSTTRRTFPRELAVSKGGWTGDKLTLGEALVSAIQSNGFEINIAKKRLQVRTAHQEVTGLTVNQFPNVKRRYTRQIRAMLHDWSANGLNQAQTRFRRKHDKRQRKNDEPSFQRVVKGKLDFLRMVKSENDPTYRRLATALHTLDPTLIELPPETEDPSSDSSDPTWAALYKTYQGSVYHVEIRRQDGAIQSGTAFTWSRRALVTSAHNLDGRMSVCPPMPDATDVTEFQLHPRSTDGVDIAIVQLPDTAERTGERIPLRRTPLQPGELIAALGYASIPQRQPSLGLFVGSVESIARDYGEKVEYVQVSIEISGGMSGGPVIDRGGHLVGVVTEKTFGEDVSSRVPGRVFRHILPAAYLLEIESNDP